MEIKHRMVQSKSLTAIEGCGVCKMERELFLSDSPVKTGRGEVEGDAGNAMCLGMRTVWKLNFDELVMYCDNTHMSIVH